MPWPMRFGPPPRMMTFFLSDGAASFGERAGERRLVGRIHVGGRRGELGGAGVDALEDRAHVERVAHARRPRLRLARRASRAARRKSPSPSAAAASSGARGQAVGLDRASVSTMPRISREEPRIDLCRPRRSARRSKPSRIACATLQQAVRRRRAERGADRVLVVALAEALDRDFVEAGQAGLERAQRLLQAIPGTCGRSPSLRRPTSSTWSAPGSAPGNFSKAKRGILVTT